MMPVGKAAELSTPTQKARALGMYMADYNVLKAIGKPTAEVEGVIAKLATDLNVSFVLDILKEQAPKDATKEQLQAFLNAQEDKIIEKMAAENDLAAYYPDLKQLGETIAPLKEKVASIQSARAANAEIMGIRDALLK